MPRKPTEENNAEEWNEYVWVNCIFQAIREGSTPVTDILDNGKNDVIVLNDSVWW